MTPSVPFLDRKLKRDVEVCGTMLKQGTIVWTNWQAMQLSPDHFTNPRTFNPDRFMPESKEKRHSFAFVPFSAGARNCIGKSFFFFSNINRSTS